MSEWDLDTGAAMGVHSRTKSAVDDLADLRTKVRDAVESCTSSAKDEQLPAALRSFWNDHAAQQAQAAQSKAKNATAALNAMVQCYIRADYENAAVASNAADAIPRDVIKVNDKLLP